MATVYVQPPCTEDDRRYTRVAHKMDLAFVTSRGQGGLAQSVNISRTGFALTLGQALRPGTKVSLMFEDEKLLEPFEVEVEIVWCRPEQVSGTYAAGVRIRAMSVSARDRLIELLESHTNTLEPIPSNAS